jgi:hypothetical protein
MVLDGVFSQRKLSQLEHFAPGADVYDRPKAYVIPNRGTVLIGPVNARDETRVSAIARLYRN